MKHSPTTAGKIEAFVGRHSRHTETPYQPLRSRRILLVAGVNSAGKSTAEGLFPSRIIQGCSAAFIHLIVEWWNALTPEGKKPFLSDIPSEFQAYFAGEISEHELTPSAHASEEERAMCYERKEAFGKIISPFLQWARDPDMRVINNEPGHAHVVGERVYAHTIHMKSAVITGMRSLGDFEYFLHALGAHEEIGLLYIDADRRKADSLRGPTERDLVKFRHDLLSLFEELGYPVWVVDSNEGTYEEYQERMRALGPELKTFLRLEEE